MTGNEVLGLCVSLIVAIIAATSLVRRRKVAEERLKLERITAELAREQLSQLNEEQRQKILPKLHVDLTKLGKSYYFLIANRGEGSAYSLNFELVDCPDSPIVRGSNEKFPHPELRSQSRVKFLATIHHGSPMEYHVRLTWLDETNVEHTEDHHVFL
jgi:hypothetical protein